MKINFVLILLISQFVFVHGQDKGNAADNALEFNKFHTFYQTAQAFRDTGSMVSALLEMISLRPHDTTNLKKLANLYFKRNDYSSAAVACKKYLDISPDDIEIIKLYALVAQSDLKFEDALLLYTELFFRTGLPEYKYFAAYMEYELFRQADCLKTIAFCKSLPSTEQSSLNVKTSGGQSQWIPLKAICLNLEGLTYLDMKEVEKAKESFEESLKIFPDYISARQNLQETIVKFNPK